MIPALLDLIGREESAKVTIICTRGPLGNKFILSLLHFQFSLPHKQYFFVSLPEGRRGNDQEEDDSNTKKTKVTVAVQQRS